MILLALLAVSFGLMKPNLNSSTGAQNLEAPYHVLLTVNALNETPAKNHWYLPIVSLGKETDKNISWGATIPAKNGNYVYTSFTPPGFLAPYIWFKIFRLEPTLENLAYFNFTLGTLSTLILFLFLTSLLKFNGYDSSISVEGALAGCAISIFSREALQSYGLIYWSQSLYQPLLILSLYLMFKYLTGETEKSRRPYAALILAAAFLGALTEWTGYIFNAGLVFLFWRNGQTVPASKTLAAKLLAVTALACVATVAHCSLAAGFKPTIVAFWGRFFTRSASAGNPANLLVGYALSYGIFILTLLPVLAFFFFSSRQQPPNDRQKITFLLFAAACIPLLENVVMLQHATQFSYDRLKFIFPAAITLAFAFARFTPRWRLVLLAFLMLASVHGYKSYTANLRTYSAWTRAVKSNETLAGKIAEKTDIGCALFASNRHVRGYASLLFHRGINEKKSPEETAALMAKSNACASVYLESVIPFPDMQQYTKAVITYRDGSTTVITPYSK